MKTRIVKETMGDGSVRYFPQYAQERWCEYGDFGEDWFCANELRVSRMVTPTGEDPFTLQWAQKTIDRVLSSEVVCSEVIEYP